jgi:hypothetical protein
MARIPKERSDSTEEALAAIEAAISRFESKQIHGTSRSDFNTGSKLHDLEDRRIGVVETTRGSSIIGQLGNFVWIQFLLLQIALVAGWFFHTLVGEWFFHDGTSYLAGSFFDENWKAISVLCGTASFGFGAATLLYSRFTHLQSSKIVEKYDDLKMRADRLVLLASELNKKSDVR